jgi:hypothetical protein
VGALVVCWIVFPLVLLLLAGGCGLLAERASGIRLPGTLVPPLGIAVIVVVAGLCTLSSTTAPFARPAAVICAIAGYVLTTRRHERPFRLDRWAIAAAAGVFVVYAAPIIFTGTATFAGYIKLDDTSTWLAITDRVMQHGRDLSGLQPSTYEAALSFYVATGYPLGSFLPWGVAHSLVGQDLIWVFQPYEAFLAAMTALCGYSLIARLVQRRWLLALAAFVGAQPALLYGYSLWGGVKELMGALLIVLAAALLGWMLAGGELELRRPLPLAVVAAATVVSLSIGGALWIVLGCGAALLILFVQRRPLRSILIGAGSFVVLAAVFALPALTSASTFVQGAGGLEDKAVGGTAEALGNLLRPLKVWQAVGIWPAGDFRVAPGGGILTVVLIAIAIIAAVYAVVVGVRRGVWGVPLLVATALFGCAVIVHVGSPWVDGKALATAAPAVLLAATAGAAMAFERATRQALVAAAGTVGACLLVGVLWSNALAYHDVNIAPRNQLRELQYIGNRFAGQGPALITDYQTYGTRHLLRKLDAEGASELRRRPVPVIGLPNGVPKGDFRDVDDFAPGALDPYRTLILRRSPTGSRPPSVFNLVWSGRFYDVWQRSSTAPVPVAHLPLGDALDPAGIATCSDARRLAQEAGPGGRLATVFRPPIVVTPVADFSHPTAWPTANGALLPDSPGTAAGTIDVPGPGPYAIWIGGSFRSKLAIAIDGTVVGQLRDVLSNTGVYVPFGVASLGPGTHRVELRYSGPDLAPGSAGDPYPLGPLALAPPDTVTSVSYIPSRNANSLCGKHLDWIEAIR